MKKLLLLSASLAVLGLIFSACGPAATEAPPSTGVQLPASPPPTEPPPPTELAFTAPEGALVAVSVDSAPTLDGVGDEAAWADAPSVTIPVSGDANMGSTEVTLKAIYTEDGVSFLASWADPTNSFLRSP